MSLETEPAADHTMSEFAITHIEGKKEKISITIGLCEIHLCIKANNTMLLCKSTFLCMENSPSATHTLFWERQECTLGTHKTSLGTRFYKT